MKDENILTFFDEFCSAFRAGNADFSFSSGNAHLLPAGRAFIEMVNFSLAEMFFLFLAFGYKMKAPVHEFLVFLIPPFNLPGHHAVIFITHTSQGKNVKNVQPGKQRNEQKHNGNSHQ